MKPERRRQQIKNIATTVLPASHRNNDTVTAFSLGFTQGMAVAQRSPFVAAMVIADLISEDAGLDDRTTAIARLLMEA